MSLSNIRLLDTLTVVHQSRVPFLILACCLLLVASFVIHDLVKLLEKFKSQSRITNHKSSTVRLQNFKFNTTIHDLRFV